ncbi:MAG: hypothetical protein ABIA04_06765 [Pseudomonadota bacterium]
MKDITKTPVGKDLVCYCTKCRMDLGHRVVAHVDGLVARVVCLTCKSEHNYRPAKGIKEAAKKEEKKTKSKKIAKTKSKPTKTEQISQWHQLIAATTMEDVRMYSISSKFVPADIIDHKTFGKGFVIKELGSKIEVLFEDGNKILIHGR